ncbi:PEP-CTERM sorting domain-containing protein [Rubritalea spongiae]|uniref:PEP-CTERM sorting domain-containing protein n=1 Tax=Rubritalea spongiae TaxID=430797 RepID=A0ABW5E1Y5_9BACT
MKKSLPALSACLLMMTGVNAATFTWDGGGTDTRLITADNWDSAPSFNNEADLILTNAKAVGSTYGNMTVRSLTFDNTATANQSFSVWRSATRARAFNFASSTGTAALTSNTNANVAINGGIHTNGTQNAVNLVNDLHITNNGTGTLSLNARIAGAGNISILGGDVVFGSAQNNYTGNTFLDAGSLSLSSGSGLSFSIGANGINNGISGAGGLLSLGGTFNLDLTGASTTLGDSWILVDATNLTETYENTFSLSSTLGSFTENSGVWSISENGIGYEFSETTGLLTAVAIPEPSSTALIGLGSLTLILRRRR